DAEEWEKQFIPDTPYLWAELGFAAQFEATGHLDDLLLRRLRLGLLTPQGGRNWIPEIRKAVQTRLGWEDSRWDNEQQRYFRLIERAYTIR
ncbi:MAG: glycerol-3-phosphate dehydrogenase C-terminal domain-containing protein, partial [Anaerolineales bacterium]